jgi:Lhr-like helicase
MSETFQNGRRRKIKLYNTLGRYLLEMSVLIKNILPTKKGINLGFEVISSLIILKGRERVNLYYKEAKGS